MGGIPWGKVVSPLLQTLNPFASDVDQDRKLYNNLILLRSPPPLFPLLYSKLLEKLPVSLLFPCQVSPSVPVIFPDSKEMAATGHLKTCFVTFIFLVLEAQDGT